MNRYPRNMIGYGPNPPDPKWPGGARVAVSFVLNYEEGGENNILHGDAASEAFLSEIIGAAPWEGKRHWNMESCYEYGARAGFWRLHRLFTQMNMPLTVYGVTDAMARSPEQVWAMQEAGWEVASHGKKWVEHKDMPEAEERGLMEEAISLHEEITGAKPRGWYTGRCSMNTVKIAADLGLDWVADTIDDDLPYWHENGKTLVIPYTMDTNDMRFAVPAGFGSPTDFFDIVGDAFATAYEEGQAGRPIMISIGLHCRLMGRPGRFQALKQFLEQIAEYEDVWVARRCDIYDHWAEHHPYVAPGPRPSTMSREDFVAAYGSVYEHSPWVAERAWELELGPAHDRPIGLWNALARAFRRASAEERLGVLQAHPDLAGKLAAAKRLTAESSAEQASAGLDALTDDERKFFEEGNARYTETFGFPFIICVKDHTKASIMAAMKDRLAHDRETELAEACRQVERIAYHRVKDLLA
ncbi:OHCU decarboxylase [Pseudooceanicola antarcticus]|uniref:Chitooligosaccharide deacetylase n=1 Tax=Pseudooceanicola antarcticus TaxID=1247613 RepID=A0A285HSA5_9RHOB|nr:allantoinase PuuE [Pseudooceanicola antarcticus]PJE27706.1 polysaccharide deacetylase [Pseudooceanicola antarcticus]SNY37611.1 OHCU decarboxylase [Pseudooceanicola antarcticus]